MNIVPIMMDESGAIVESNLLMKITKEQYAEDILSGKLYMNSLRYFRELEQEGVGDEQEGALCIGATGDLLYKGQIIAKVKNLRAYYDFPVFCALSVPLNQVGESDYAFLIPQKMLREFMYDRTSKYTAVLINRCDFEERLEKALVQYKIMGCLGKVQYSDKIIPYSSEEKLKVAFCKRKKFAYQNEWRIALDFPVEDRFVLDVGDISDIACKVPIDNSEQEMKIEVHSHA